VVGFQENEKVVTRIDYLRKMILSGELKSDREIFTFMLNSGCISVHVKPIILDLTEKKKIILKTPSFKTSTVWKKKRMPQLVELI